MFFSIGLTMLIPYLLTTHSQWSHCRLRVFSLANKKDELEREQRRWVIARAWQCRNFNISIYLAQFSNMSKFYHNRSIFYSNPNLAIANKYWTFGPSKENKCSQIGGEGDERDVLISEILANPPTVDWNPNLPSNTWEKN